MTQTLTRSLSATAAIAAVLALGSNPTVAQEAAPTIQVPPITAAPAVPETSAAPATASVAPPAANSPSAPAPTIVLPDVTTTAASPPTASTATAEPAPARSETPRSSAPRGASIAPQRTSSATPIATRSTVAGVPARSAAPAAATPAEQPRASTANILNDAPSRPVTAQDTPPPAAPAPRSNDGIPGEMLAGLLAALGIGAVGYAAMRSRRRRVEADDAYIADEAVAAEPIHEEDTAPRTAPVFGTPQHAAPATQWRYDLAPVCAGDAETQVIEREPVTMAQPLAPNREHTRGAVAMPTSLPTTAEERATVLDRMVDAAPDQANPFTSRKSRRKRARLLLQQHEAAAQRSEPFDWRSYSPSTKPSTPAYPPLVTA